MDSRSASLSVGLCVVLYVNCTSPKVIHLPAFPHCTQPFPPGKKEDRRKRKEKEKFKKKRTGTGGEKGRNGTTGGTLGAQTKERKKERKKRKKERKTNRTGVGRKKSDGRRDKVRRELQDVLSLSLSLLSIHPMPHRLRAEMRRGSGTENDKRGGNGKQQKTHIYQIQSSLARGQWLLSGKDRKGISHATNICSRLPPCTKVDIIQKKWQAERGWAKVKMKLGNIKHIWRRPKSGVGSKKEKRNDWRQEGTNQTNKWIHFN